MESKQLFIDGKATYLLIYEDGRLYTTRRKKFLKPMINSSGYIYYNLQHICGRTMGIARLVALHFIGESPDKYKKEINHKDSDKMNNHWSNLEWITRRENIIRARNNDPWYCSGRKSGFRMSEETKRRMAYAKYRPVMAIRGDKKIVFGSIEELLEYFNIYRRKFNRYVNSVKKINGWSFRYA